MKHNYYPWQRPGLRLLALTALLVGLTPARDYAGYSGSFLRIGTSARSIAMGSAFTAELDRGFTAYHNPAGVVFLDKKQATVLHHSLPLDRQFLAASFSTGLPPTAGLGFAWISSGVGNIDGRSYSGFKTEKLTTSEDALYISFANQISPGLAVGINIKLLFNRLPINSSDLTGKGTGFDLGIMYRKIPNLTVALTATDINSKYAWNTSDALDEEGRVYNDYFPTFFRLGAGYQLATILLTADYGYCVDLQEGYYLGSAVRFGAEYRWSERYFVRGGFGNTRVAMGVGMNYSFWKENDAYLDYAVVYELPTGLAHVFTYAFNF
ncbi:MAG: hypothetical protein ABIA75_06980 [Candidatus Neomarinimicrobiota bacterium]